MGEQLVQSNPNIRRSHRRSEVIGAMTSIVVLLSGCGTGTNHEYEADKSIQCVSIKRSGNGTPLFDKPEIPSTAENRSPDEFVKTKIQLAENMYLHNNKVYLTLYDAPLVRKDGNGKWIGLTQLQLMPAFNNPNDVTSMQTSTGRLWLLTGGKNNTTVEKMNQCKKYSETYIG